MAAWLRELMAEGVIADGVVDDRSIVEVCPQDLRDFTQCHFFAGVGVWSYSLRQAGWPDDRPAWTGSCPCQPFSMAGSQKGISDERHLWPAWEKLIASETPEVVFGEQVSSAEVIGKVKNPSGTVWWDVVQSDLERASYASAAFDLPVAGFGGPHIRQRLFFIAQRVHDSKRSRLEGHDGTEPGICKPRRISQNPSRSTTSAGVPDVGLVNNDGHGRSQGMPASEASGHRHTSGAASRDGGPSPTNGFWRAVDWIFCRDNKWRPVKPGLEPLVNGTSTRLGQGSGQSPPKAEVYKKARTMMLKGYGNAIVAPVATEFITAFMDLSPETTPETAGTPALAPDPSHDEHA